MVPLPAASFVRGNVDQSPNPDDPIDTTDAVTILRYLFLGEKSGAAACPDAADADDSGQIDISDAVYLLKFRFLGGQPPPAPFPSCWFDETPDELACESFSACDPMGVVFVIDRSISSYQNTPALDYARKLVPAILSQLSRDDQFGMVFFDAQAIRFPEDNRPSFADPASISEAIDRIKIIQQGFGSCPDWGLRNALLYVDLMAPLRSVILYLSPCYEWCPRAQTGGGAPGADQTSYQRRVVDDISAQNIWKAEIHTARVGRDIHFNDFLPRELARRNNGTFRRIQF
jgi:hypothetical protein